ncbi:MAG TPA: ATP-binding protein [Methylocystis sp.]|nr:ATP-binding protein [Methylocystis sp.]
MSPKNAMAFAARSIARRLFFTAAAVSIVVLLVASTALTQYYRRNAEDVWNTLLESYIRTIVADEAHHEAIQLGEPKFNELYSGWYWQVTRVDENDAEPKTSPSLSASLLPKLPETDAKAGEGRVRSGGVLGPDGRRLRLMEQRIDSGETGIFLVQVAVPVNAAEREIDRFQFALTVAFTLLAVALAVATAIQLGFGLRPLRALQGELGEIRRGGRERIAGAYPTELQPLVDELNLLIGVNRDIVERARVQVGNLAHALKTPLSVIINEADATPSPLAEKVGEQAAIMRDQITFYLDRARAAARAGALGSSTKVEPVIAALLRTFSKIYAERGVAYSGSAPGDLCFLGERQDLEEMVGNLLDNAGKWANEAVSISVSVDAEASVAGRKTLLLTIEDDGAGLPEKLRAEATQRGRRLDETKPGSGLGLSIVTDLAAAYGGSLSLDESPRGGLRALLRLPGF